MKTTSFLIIALAAVIAAQPASAQIELEVDPLAYALGGYSAHVAYGSGHYRIDVGTFGIDIPEAFQSNEGFTASIPWGIGLKAHRFFRSERKGLFIGTGASYGRLNLTHDATGAQASEHQVGVGVEIGYRFPVGRRGFYITPWLGLDHVLTGGEMTLGGAHYAEQTLRPFPTIHLGWRL